LITLFTSFKVPSVECPSTKSISCTSHTWGKDFTIGSILSRSFLTVITIVRLFGGEGGYKDGDFELLFGSARMGLKFGEIPMRYYPRTYGVPKTKAFRHGIYLLKMAARGYWLFRRN